MVKMLRQQRNKELSQAKSDVQMLIDSLHVMKSRDPGFRFAYVLENELDEKSQEPRIDRMLI